jgi:hypothetical protein
VIVKFSGTIQRAELGLASSVLTHGPLTVKARSILLLSLRLVDQFEASGGVFAISRTVDRTIADVGIMPVEWQLTVNALS